MARTVLELPRALIMAKEAFESWREVRTSRRIPDELWSRAIALAQRYGVSRTAHVLRLGYRCLKRRVKDANPPEPLLGQPFVEVLPSASVSAFCRVEMAYPDGARLSIELSGMEGQDLRMLGPVIWRTGE